MYAFVNKGYYIRESRLICEPFIKAYTESEFCLRSATSLSLVRGKG